MIPLEEPAEEALHKVFGLGLITNILEQGHGLTCFVERNVMTRHDLAAALERHELHQLTSVVVIVKRVAEATRRILEERTCKPWGSDGTSITALLQKLEFRFQHSQKISIVLWHYRQFF